jgi:hypothetical protein
LRRPPLQRAADADIDAAVLAARSNPEIREGPRQAAGENAVGAAWASNVCSTSQMFCHHPEYLAYAAGVMLVLAVIAKLIRVVS